MKRIGTVLLGVGVVALVAGLVMQFAIVPGLLQYPDDVDQTRQFEGVLGRMLNAEALAAGDAANIFLTDVPVTIDRTVKVLEVDGEKALVEDTSVMNGPAGPVLATENVYTIDRKTMEHIPNFTDDERVIDREGLVVGFPIGTEAKDYEGWNGDTQTTNTITYDRTETHEGMETRIFQATSGPDPITSPEMLANFPPALPKATIEALVPALGLPAEAAGQLAELLPALPDPVPLAYTYAYTSNYWVDPETGVLIDFDKVESRAVAIDLGDQQIPVAEVMQLEYQLTDASIQDAVADAEDAQGTIRLFGTIIPLALIIGGILAAIIGFVVMRRESAS